MPRPPRLFLPDQPQHIVVRGHNRDPILTREEDFRFLYQCLRKAAFKNNLSIHAWVFMNNHIHLLATPEHKKSLPKTMQSIGRCYAQYFNRMYHRSGSIWEGRYKSCLIDTENYLLSCYRYIELNPVRAGVARKPEDYAYSSFHANALGMLDSLVSPHVVFRAFISSKVSESKTADSDTLGQGGRSCYRDLCAQLLDRKTLDDIRRGTEKGLGIGSANFMLNLARMR